MARLASGRQAAVNGRRSTAWLVLVAALTLAVASCAEGNTGVAESGSPNGGDSEEAGADGEDGSSEDGDDGSDGDGSTDAGSGDDGTGDDGSSSGDEDDGSDGEGSAGDGSDEGDGNGDGGGGSDAELPGEPYDVGPLEGEALDVVNVAFDDVLNFRTLPNPSAPIVDTAAPQSATPVVLSAGDGRLLPQSAWWRVTIDGEEAWANTKFLGVLGPSDDVTAAVTDELGTGLVAETLVDLSQLVAGTRSQESGLTVTQVSAFIDLGGGDREVTIDVDGFADDAVSGERLVIVAAEHESGEGFVILQVTATAICSRGAGTGGFCR